MECSGINALMHYFYYAIGSILVKMLQLCISYLYIKIMSSVGIAINTFHYFSIHFFISYIMPQNYNKNIKMHRF
jgi:hypothetical protein